MNRLFLGTIFCLYWLSSYAQEQTHLNSLHVPIQEITVKGNFFALYSYFDIKSAEGTLGKVVKEKYNLWTHYGFYGKDGDKDLIAETYINLLSIGKLFSWSSVMDVYTPSAEYLGTIEGWWLTFSPAKFSFFDKYGKTLAIAYMDFNKMTFTLLDPNDYHLIANYSRIILDNESDHWLISIYDESEIPKPLLILFGAFAADHQDNFRADGDPELLEPVKDKREIIRINVND